MELNRPVCPAVWVLTCGHLKDDHAKGPDVARVGVLHALKTLRRPSMSILKKYLHVAESACERARMLLVLLEWIKLLTYAEVTQLGQTEVRLHKDIVGF
jgi:hypothetical protein